MNINPENVHRVQTFIRDLLQGLDSSPHDRISLLEQATALEQYAAELRAIAADQYQRSLLECDLSLFLST